MPKAETRRSVSITSASNPLLKEIRRAVARGGLTADGCCVAETAKLLEEALRSGCEVRAVLVSESAWPKGSSDLGVRTTAAPDRLLRSISSTQTSAGVVALVKPPVWSASRLFVGAPLVVVLDGIQDPGNAGAILRSAEAFGATGALFLKGSVSPHNPKTLRASAGSLFRLPYLSGLEPAAALELIREHNMSVYAASASGGSAVEDTDFTGPCALIIGSEARGVAPELRAAAREVSIPTDAVESLNAAVAAGVLLYEARRQRAGRR